MIDTHWHLLDISISVLKQMMFLTNISSPELLYCRQKEGHTEVIVPPSGITKKMTKSISDIATEVQL